MKSKIKETCSCGAILEYEEELELNQMSGMSFRQATFHQAHEKCKKK